ncbi:hypothetical protein KWI07_05090 [Enterobacter bugandensis]|uniref:hypothetical protein n=1 Tax=Enterobacter bugandensis TaxID=881260 RepID=UPI0021CE8C06|nr:hypothetical protein [Enterobacter bugandensis]MCU6159797.1 hypothetical protein [Enterobacter bugandensis]
MTRLTAELRRLMFACSFLMLAGCAGYTGVLSPASTQVGAARPLQVCQDELAVIKQYDAARYEQHNGKLTALLNNSARYLLTRDQVSNDITSVVDGVLQSRLAQECQDIHITLYKSILAQSGEDAGQ